MRITVDAMGGDFAPREIVRGSLDALRITPEIDRLFLVGDETAVSAELKELGGCPDRVEIRHASEVVEMGEAPATAIRRKKDSSINRAIEMVKNGEASAVFSAGSTGAAVAGAHLRLRTLPGVERPAIATMMPTQDKPFVLLDAGANAECTPRMLLQFAAMGSIYIREIFGRKNPKIGLLNIGGEAAKGNDMSKAAHALLEKSPLNFIGNVESGDCFAGNVDVAVCDGFTGNVVLKTSEGVAQAVGHWFKEEFTRNPMHMMAAVMLSRGIGRIKKRCDPAVSGGAPLLGTRGAVIIGHGSSSSHAACNAVRVAANWVSHDINQLIQDAVKEMG